MFYLVFKSNFLNEFKVNKEGFDSICFFNNFFVMIISDKEEFINIVKINMVKIISDLEVFCS